MMSALGHKQTLEQASEMSALPTKADMRLAVQKCPLSAINRHSPRGERLYQLLWAEIRGDKAAKRKAALTMAGGKYQEQLKRRWRTFRW